MIFLAKNYNCTFEFVKVMTKVTVGPFFKTAFLMTSQLRHHYVVSCKYWRDILQFFSHADCQDNSRQKLSKVLKIFQSYGQNTVGPFFEGHRFEGKTVKVSGFIQRSFCSTSHSRCLGMDHSFTCKLHHACLYLVSVHQMALPLTLVTFR